MSGQFGETAHVRSFAQESQEQLLTDVVDAILSDVFQDRRSNLRTHMLNVAAKVSRKHPWPFFEQVVAAEVERRLAGGEPREWFVAAMNESRVRTPSEQQQADA